jgi:acyl carrier protein phosphodiesterase
MNYLAHAYLSFNQPEILVGNMVSDFVKGKSKFTYSPGIQKGITLHRAIDQFTDDHPATHVAKQFFKPAYRLYAGAFIDVVYDHFLATDINEFVGNDLEKFSNNVYKILNDNILSLPQGFKQVFPFMQMQNWLCNYQYKWGIDMGFKGLVNRAAYINESSTAFSIFNKYYFELRDCYDQFFYYLKQFAHGQLSNL